MPAPAVSLGLRLQNLGGELARDPELLQIRDTDEVLLLTETWMCGDDLPSIPGFHNGFGAARAGSSRGARGGVAVYLANTLPPATLWKQRKQDGVLWIRVLVEDALFFIAVCYLPPKNSGGYPSDQIESWFQQLAAEITEARREGMVLVAGDFNARVADDPDFPEQFRIDRSWNTFDLLEDAEASRSTRRSCDQHVNEQGKRLLELCKETGLRIVNGRTPGDEVAAATSVGKDGNGKSVVDLFLCCPKAMPLVSKLLVSEKMAPNMDHNSVFMELSLPSPDPSPSQLSIPSSSTSEESSLPSLSAEVRREFLVTADTIPLFVEYLQERVVASTLLDIQERAEAGLLNTAEALNEAARDLNTIFVAAAISAGMKEKEEKPPQPPWMLRVERRPFVERSGRRALRRHRRQALRSWQLAAAREVSRQLRQLDSRGRRRVRWKNAQRLETLLKDQPKEFYRRYRDKRASTSSSITPEEFGRHFETLLGGQPPNLPLPLIVPGSIPLEDQMSGLVQEPFSQEEVCESLKKVRNGSVVLGVLKPQLLKAALKELVPVLTALCNAAVSVGRLPDLWAVSSITAILKGGGNHSSVDGYRGIAVGTLLAKLYASVLDVRMSAWAETGDLRAAGQFGFRKRRGCAQAAFVLRTMIDQAICKKQKLFTCFVDFKKAYDSVPRDLLWEKLQRRGVTGWVLQAVKALYANVPMCVKSPTGYSGFFEATMGVKQGCPLSPLLFGMYIDDLEGELLAAVNAGVPLDAPMLQDTPVPSLLYADDLAQMSLSVAGLKKQMEILKDYANRWGLTVNVGKTKIVVFAARRSRKAENETKIYFGDSLIEVVPEFTYLGILFVAGKGCTAATRKHRCSAGRRALHAMRRRFKELQLQRAETQFKLFDVFVEPVLSYGMEVWALQDLGSSAPQATEAERLHVSLLREVLGVRKSTANIITLAECARWPLEMRWIKRIVRFYNRLVAAPASSLLSLALTTSIQLMDTDTRQHQTWAAEFSRAMSSFGIEVELGQPLARDEVVYTWQQKYLQRVAATAGTKREFYFQHIRKELTSQTYTEIPEYLQVLEKRGRRRALAQLRTGSHWLQEEVGRWNRPLPLPREQRVCPHCVDSSVVEDIFHTLFDCPFIQSVRERFPQLYESEGEQDLAAFLTQSPAAVATLATAIYKHQEETYRQRIALDSL